MLTESERQTLARIAEIMIPGGLGMPSARDIDLQATPTDWVLSFVPQLVAPLKKFLGNCDDIQDLSGLQSLAKVDPEGFDAMSKIVANAYFADDRVREAIGYPGQEARDVSGGLTSEDLSMTASVTARGPIWRSDQ